MPKEEGLISFFIVTGDTLDAFLVLAENLTETNREILKKSSQFAELGFRKLIEAVVDNEAPRPLLSILRIARQRYRCFALIESPYFDLEDWEAYAAFYSHSFTPFERLCCRVHFFEGSEEDGQDLIEAFRNGIDQESRSEWLNKKLGEDYKGFFVLRPFRTFVVGRTVIKFDERPPNDTRHVERHRLEETGQPYCTGKIANEFHISSLRMTIDTAPAVQQNPVVGVCATASAWVASQILSGRFGLHKFPFNKITRQALTHDYDDTFFDDGVWKLGGGLTLAQIQQALARTGAIPYLCSPSNTCFHSSQARMRFLAYTFVESGLPVIVAYRGLQGGHAVTLVGHLLPGPKDGHVAAEAEADLLFGIDPQSRQPRITTRRHLIIGQAVQMYYAHNDAYGPFDRLRLLSDREIGQKKEEASDLLPHRKTKACLVASWGRPDDRGNRKEILYSLHGLVIPLPPYIQNNSPERFLLDAIKKFDKLLPPPEGQPISQNKRILWRCFLASAPDFKQSVVRRDYPEEMCRRYMTLHLPLFVWVMEFTLLRPDDRIPYAAPRSINGEFLYDSTTPSNQPQCLSARIGNRFCDFRSEEGFEVIGKEQFVKCFIPRKTRM